ncbi:hypothetical protein H1R20_g2486, partial [Candolleomyces eurysporus]
MASHPNQSEILEKFRSDLVGEGLLQDGDSIGTDDETLLRFLKARKFDLQHSKQMFKDCYNWRKNVENIGIDELYRKIDPFDFPERNAIFDCWPMWFHKTDKQGRPLNVHFFGGMDVRRLYKVCTPERHWQSFLVNCELLPREVLPACSRAAGKHIGGTFVIVDLKGFSMGQLAIVNAPSSFTMIWAMIKPWISKETAAKVDILGSDYAKVLLELIDEENLPSTLGGKCTCAEHGGCHLSGAGPWMEGRVGWGPNAQAKRQVEQHAEIEILNSKLGASKQITTTTLDIKVSS